MNKPETTIQDVRLESQEERDALVVDLDRFLGKYSDPRPGMLEALEEARRSGFIFEAIDRSCGRVGIVVITATRFNTFQPYYHLAYIATSPEYRGRGAGKFLLSEALKRTDGNLALHVSPDNEAAVAFYERQGWKIKYLRMLPAALHASNQSEDPAEGNS